MPTVVVLSLKSTVWSLVQL